MQRNTVILTFFLLAAFFFLSCKSNTADIYSDIDNPSSPSKTVGIKLPVYKSGSQEGTVNWIYGYIQKQTADAGLDTLQAGFKDLQIRIWLHDWLAIKKNLVILSRTNRKWSGALITMTYEYNVPQQEHRMASKTSRQIVPKSGWNHLFRQLLELKIMSIDNMEDLPNYKVGDDGVDYIFEIATKYQYRMFHYWSPDLYTDKFWQAKNIVSMVKLLQNEFALENVK